MRAITFKTSYEDIITRITGLFAYIDVDKNGNTSLHKATDNPMGCYGKIVENLEYSKSSDLRLNDNILLKSEGTYPFKTLMNLYYKYKDYEENSDNEIIDENNNIITGFSDLRDFIERGIGKVAVTISKTNEMDLVPEYIFLIQAEKLYNELYNLKIICDLYEIHMENKTELDKETEIDMCCKCRQFYRKGGNKMLEFLKDKIEECEKVAQDYFVYAQNRKNGLSINYNINLFSSDRDLGLVTPIETIGSKVSKKMVYNDKDFKDYFEETFTTNSKLKSLRKRPKYINALDEEEMPDSTEDWLYFYRVGHISNITVLNDNLGNISTVNTKINDIQEDKEIKDLYAYGDIIESITLSDATIKYYRDGIIPNSNDEGEVNFDDMLNAFKVVYWTDIHLTARCNSIAYDDNGNKIIYFDEFKPDYWYRSGCGGDPDSEINYHGIRYEEIYYFNDNSEIVDLIKEGKFDDYIKGKFDTDYLPIKDEVDDVIELKLFEKYTFSLYNNTRTHTKQLSQTKVDFNDIISEATVRITQYVDEIETVDTDSIKIDDGSEIIIYPNSVSRHEFYEGITYTPSEELNVYIDRGTTSIFDKHIRFGEIKTLQDMEEFTNGSFFKLQE